MNKLKSKLKSKKGFTLIEMLIVVAIIAILVVIAFPVVTSSLDDAKAATDKANFRSAKAVALIEAMNKTTTINNYYFNANTGEFQSDKKGAYQAQTTDEEANGRTENDYIQVKITGNTADVEWVTG